MSSALDERRCGTTAEWTSMERTADQRNEAIATLATAIFHDLRNPLATIHSGAELLSGTHLPEQQVRRVARNIYNASLRVQQLLQDYVDLYRTAVSPREPSDLRSVISGAAGKVAAAAEAQSVAVEVQEIPDSLVVSLNRGQIGSVLANLLANALEVQPAGGSIHITAAAADNSVVVRVLDSGPGVAPEIRDRLFEPFATARKPNGWGFGLAIARQILVEHGGEIWLEDPPGPGACFAFRLPLL